MAVIWLALSSVTAAQTDAATAETLMRKSGLWQQLSSVAPQIRAGIVEAFSQGGLEVSAAESQRIGKAVDASYAADRLRSLAKAVIAKQTDAKFVRPLREWYESPLGLAITKMEEAAAAAARDQNQILRDGTATLETVSPSRRALIGRLVAITRLDEAMTTLTIDTALGIQAGVLSMNPDTPAPGDAEFRRLLESQRPQMLKAFAGMSPALVADAYSKLSDSDLGRYVDFLESESGRHFTDVGIKALDAALTEAARTLGQKIPGSRDGANT